ncbi:PaaI family thioesterase [Amycolatopsis sp. YIM 10]|uniref:PaaI family thioesterase n=1 Tax=Amycolatopsis sp. YIM 10 TaxID=2653857 RepID=UPI00128FF32D|nr:PaaI family thioesterase [Amycolatopsis sp. YIM 10]QFU91603.1 hypothetical protein YIM_32210 [Amycolatopsis sp. YIM 10]
MFFNEHPTSAAHKLTYSPSPGRSMTIKHSNPNGTVHGGVPISLLDYTLDGTTEQVLASSADGGLATARQHTITISLTTQFSGGARHGLPLFGRAWVQRRTRSIAFVAGEPTSGDLTVATASAIFKTPRQPGA